MKSHYKTNGNPETEELTQSLTDVKGLCCFTADADAQVQKELKLLTICSPLNLLPL